MKRTIHYCVYTAWCACHHDFGIFLPSFSVTALLSHMKWWDISLCFVLAFLWWLMMLSIFICAHGSFVHLLWRNVFLDTLSIFNWLAYFIFSFWFIDFLYIIYTNSLSEIWFANIFFLHFAGFFFFFTLLMAPFKAQQCYYNGVQCVSFVASVSGIAFVFGSYIRTWFILSYLLYICKVMIQIRSFSCKYPVVLGPFDGDYSFLIELS